MSLQPGTRLGPYEVVSPLGAGGMGEVYKCRDSRLGRLVAVKVLAASLTADERYRMRLEREAKTISQLQHPNICTLHDIGAEGDAFYLVMEFLEGESLAERLRAGPLPMPEIARVGAEIAEAIETAHRGGVVHRDLKPGNVMLSRMGTKVLDFGLAKSAEILKPTDDSDEATLTQPLTAAGRIVGTLPYMAPEQLESKPTDARTDVWALGCVLYEMATGRRPFSGDSRAGLITAIMSTQPEPILREESLSSDRLDHLVRRCLEKDPEKRWQSARDVALELEEMATEGASWSATRPAAAAPTAVVTASGRRRTRTLAAGAALVVVVLAGLAALQWWSPSQPPPAVVESGVAVAVLPFDNLTGNDELDYVGLGLAAGVLSKLSELPTLNMVSRSQTWSALETASSTAQLAETLSAGVVVEGEVHSEGPGLRVDVAVTDGPTSAVLWNGSQRGTSDDLFALESAIARALAPVLSVELTAEQRRRLARGGPSAQAFDYYLQGLERLEQGDNPRHLEFAVDLFRQAIRIDPDVAVFHAALSDAIWWASGENSSAAIDAEAEQAARKAVELDPKLPQGHLALARTLRRGGRYAESIARIRPVLARHPKPDEAYRELAAGYRMSGDLEASGEALRSAVGLGPDNWFNWNQLGVFHARRGEAEEAREALEKALELAPPTVTSPRHNLGAAKLMQGDNAGAIADFEATGATTSNAELASNMGTAYFFQGDVERAAELYRRAVELDPENHTVRRNLGDALLELGRGEEAAAEYRAAMRIAESGLAAEPQSNELLRSRALYAAKAGDCGLAVSYAQEARELLSDSWQDQLDLAMTFALCERPDAALAALEKCLAGGLPASFLRQQAELASVTAGTDFARLAAAAERSAAAD